MHCPFRLSRVASSASRLVVALLLAQAAWAQTPGPLDPAWGVGGIASTSFPLGATLTALVPTADDGVVAAGLVRGEGGAFAVVVVRYTAIGRPDLAFGDGAGQVLLDLDAAGHPVHLVTDAEGRLLLGADVAPTAGGAVLVRLLPDGTSDAAFGVGGHVRLVDHSLAALAVYPDGRPVFASRADRRSDIVRLTEDGDRDDSFGDAGVLSFAYAATPDMTSHVSALAVQPDGKLVLAGQAYFTNADAEAAVARLRSDGRYDQHFGIGGVRVIEDDVRDEHLVAVHVLPDGRIVAGGDLGGLIDPFDVVRLTPDGRLDGTFGDDGIVEVLFEGTGTDWAALHTLVAEPDGGLVMAGTAPRGASGASSALAVARVRPDGTLDPAFGQEGRLTLELGESAYGGHVVRAANGALLIGGTVRFGPLDSDAAFAVVRLSKAGTTDTDAPGSGTAPLVLSFAGPNPTSGDLRLTVNVGVAGPLGVDVFDMLGRRVAVLHDGDVAAGRHPLVLHSTALSPGVYLVRATTDGGSAVLRLTLSR